MEKYLSEKTKHELIIKKDYANYKAVMEEIDKKYTLCLKTYLDHLSNCSTIKIKLEILIEEKSSFEKMLESFKQELQNTKLINNMNTIRGSDNTFSPKKKHLESVRKESSVSSNSVGNKSNKNSTYTKNNVDMPVRAMSGFFNNYGFNVSSDSGNNKKAILEQESNKIQKKLDLVDEEVRKTNKLLFDNVNILLIFIINKVLIPRRKKVCLGKYRKRKN